ncbi:hypothetical protein CFN58_34275 [Pseudomonas avellanae]|uniref:Uncharacterized protein n=1 Tax=Pseudomonas avellanae TaxID=46257 RepID=A0A261WA94_9PSED|nr:hypothetical protein CFN58_34275 [Pseudomonas avellanae]
MVPISPISALNIPTEFSHQDFSKTAQISIARGPAKRLARNRHYGQFGTARAQVFGWPGRMKRDEIRRKGKSVEEIASSFVVSPRPASITQRAATIEKVANMVAYTTARCRRPRHPVSPSESMAAPSTAFKLSHFHGRDRLKINPDMHPMNIYGDHGPDLA